MALTGGTLSNLEEVMKNFYLPATREQLNEGTPLSDMMAINEEDVSGLIAKMNIHYGRSGAVGARADNQALPTPGYQKYKQAEVPMKYLYGRIEVSGPTMAATRDDRGAYERALDSEIRGITMDMMREINRMRWGCGYGVCGRWESTTSTTAYVLQSDYRGNAAGGDGFGSAFGTKYFGEIGNATPVVCTFSSGCTAAAVTDPSTATQHTVSVTPSSHTITFGANPSVVEAAGTFYVRGDTAGQSMASLTSASEAGAGRKEIMGLRGIVTDTDIDDIAFFNATASSTGFAAASAPAADTLQGLAVASYPIWKSHVDTHTSGRYAGQRALTFNLMDKMFDSVELSAGEGYGPDSIWTTQAIRREYLELCRVDRRTVNSMKLDGGWNALDFNGIPLLVDPIDAVDGEMYFLTLKDIQMYRMSDFDWMNKDGAILSRVSNYDAYEATLFTYMEMGTSRRNAHGVICDLSYTPTKTY